MTSELGQARAAAKIYIYLKEHLTFIVKNDYDNYVLENANED